MADPEPILAMAMAYMPQLTLVEVLSPRVGRRPPGYGKTSLVSHWLETRSAATTDAPGAWLSLDESDSDRAVFLRGVVAAVRSLFAEACEDTAALTRVPLVIKPPAGGRYRRGAVVTPRVRAFDLMPTLLELAGIETPRDGLDARSLLPFLRSSEVRERERVALSHNATSAAFQRGRFKYILPVGRGIHSERGEALVLGGEELYNLTRDPEELHDLSAESPQVLDGLREETFEYLLGAVGGRFLPVRDLPGAAGRRLRVTCEPACTWDPLLQLGRERLAAETPETAVFEGDGLGGGLFFARFSAPPRTTVRVDRLAGDAAAATNGSSAVAEVVPFEPGIVRRLLRRDGPGAWILWKHPSGWSRRRRGPAT